MTACLLLTAPVTACGSSSHVGATSPTSATPSLNVAKARLRLSDLPAGWSLQSVSMPAGYSLNNGGPIGRYQVQTCTQGQDHSLVFTASDDFGTDDKRAWDVVITGGDLSAVFTLAGSPSLPPTGQSSQPADCFLGVLETESIQVNPVQFLGPGNATFGKFRTASIDLGSFGLRTASQEVTLPYTTTGSPISGRAGVTGGQSGQAFLDVAVVEFPRQIVIFGFWTSGEPPTRQVSQQVIQNVVARVS